MSALFLFYMLEKNWYAKTYILIASLLVGCMLLGQKVHYTIDILFAPIGSWLGFQLVQYFHILKISFFKKSRLGKESWGRNFEEIKVN
jgi:hypothetical protein